MSIEGLADSGLPFNRKERYFTGTVLPMLVCAEQLAHFGRLTELVGLGSISVDAHPDSANVQFFTEYGFAESLVGAAAERFPQAPIERDTPDVLIYIAGPPRALIAIEAKVYDRPTRAELHGQLTAQASLLRYLAQRLVVEPERLAHVALLPRVFAAELGELGWPLLTWEQLLDAYRDVAPPYFVRVLQVALDRYPQLASQRPSFGANAELRLTGEEIYRRHQERALVPVSMGRQGGLGACLAHDLESSGWRRQIYECSSQPPRNPNWFPVEEFILRVDALLAQGT